MQHGHVVGYGLSEALAYTTLIRNGMPLLPLFLIGFYRELSTCQVHNFAFAGVRIQRILDCFALQLRYQCSCVAINVLK